MRSRSAVDLCILLPSYVALAACHRSEPQDNRVVVVNAARVPQRISIAPEPKATRAPTARQAPIATIPAGQAGPNPQLSRPAFRDPPLPPELTTDNGLLPLPPPPPLSAFQGEKH